MGMLRCPTCLALLDGGEARCPACRTRLRKRSQPIVLGEKARLTSRPQLQLDRELHEAEEAKYAEARRRRRVAEATHRSAADTRPVTPRPTEPAEFVAELVWTPEPEAEVVIPEPVPQVASLETRSEPEIILDPEPEREISALLLDEPDPEPEPEVITPAPIFAPIEREPVVPAQLFARVNNDQDIEPAPRPLLFTSLTPTSAPTREPADEPARAYAAPERAPEPALDDATLTRFGLFDLTSDAENAGPREEYRPAPSRSQRFIDLTTDAEAEVAHEVDLEDAPDRSTGESMHEMFEALHRKARAQDNEHDNSVPDLDAYAKPPTSRALRLTGTRTNRRRRWSAEPREGTDES